MALPLGVPTPLAARNAAALASAALASAGRKSLMVPAAGSAHRTSQFARRGSYSSLTLALAHTTPEQRTGS
jgi:hypothetical protein